ncbi:unnamed protein product [Lampetra planeri]
MQDPEKSANLLIGTLPWSCSRTSSLLSIPSTPQSHISRPPKGPKFPPQITLHSMLGSNWNVVPEDTDGRSAAAVVDGQTLSRLGRLAHNNDAV